MEMTLKRMLGSRCRARTGGGRWFRLSAAAALLAASGVAAQTQTEPYWDPADPRIGLRAGWMDAAEAARHMELLANVPRPEGFYDPQAIGDLSLANSDMAFRADFLFLGNFQGFNIYDISEPSRPRLRVSVVCPGGQGDLSVYGNLLFMSVEENRGRVDCGTQGAPPGASPERFRGVRVFDLSDPDRPRQVAAVQTCRGSHTHTLLAHPGDRENVYVYVQGTSGVRPAEELEGCSRLSGMEDPNTALFRIEVIQVPLAAPQNARLVSGPRVFADRMTGAAEGLRGLTRQGEPGGATDHCHDLTTFPALGLAAGACQGNGILLDVSDPVNPVRLAEVADANFAYWHSATFNNDGTKVIFTDEWGGGTSARCRTEDPYEWGANAIFDLVDGELRFASYYKLPVPQAAQENCVAHNGSLVPVPGRDIKVQAWYQGGVSVFDFTDAAKPIEIAFFDRGPVSDGQLVVGGHWSAYWYNGYIYGSEIARGLDVFQLTPSEHLSQNEIDAARLVRLDEFNAQHQPLIEWPADFVVPRAYLDQLERRGGLQPARITELRSELDAAERLPDASARRGALSTLATGVEQDAAAAADPEGVRTLAASIRKLAEATE